MDPIQVYGTDIAMATDKVSTGGGKPTINSNNSVSFTSTTSESNEIITPWECQLFMENVSIQFDNSSSLIPLKGKTDVISMAKHGKIYLDGDKYRDETAWDQLCDDIKVACNLSGYYMRKNGKNYKKIKSGMEVIEEIEVLRFLCYHGRTYKKAVVNAEPKVRKRKTPRLFPLACEKCNFAFEIYRDKIGFMFNSSVRTMFHSGHPKRNPSEFKRPRIVKVMTEEQKCERDSIEQLSRNGKVMTNVHTDQTRRNKSEPQIPKVPIIDCNGNFVVNMKSERLGIDVNKDNDLYICIKKVDKDSPLKDFVQINDRIISINETNIGKELSLKDFMKIVRSVSKFPKIIKLNRPSISTSISTSTNDKTREEQKREIGTTEQNLPTVEKDQDNGDGTEGTTHAPAQSTEKSVVQTSAVSNVHIGHQKRNPIHFKSLQSVLGSKILTEEQKCEVVLLEERRKNGKKGDSIVGNKGKRASELLPRAPDIDSNGYYIAETNSNRLELILKKDKDSYFVVKGVKNESSLNGLVQINDRIISINAKHMRKELSLTEFVEYVCSISTIPKIIKFNRPSLKVNLSKSTSGLGKEQETESNSEEKDLPTHEKDVENGDGTENTHTYEPVQYTQENTIEASTMTNSENDISNTHAVEDPKDCKVMISFHDETGGADAEKLSYFLNHFNIPTFFRGEFSLINSTNSIVGSNKCQYVILMLTDGWQKSKNCQREAEILKKREVANDITIIPIWYTSFNTEKDSGEYGHFHWERWNSRPCIMFRETSPDWINQTITLLKSLKIDEIQENDASTPKQDVSHDLSYCQIRNEGEKEYFKRNYDNALTYYELALKICENVHGPQSPKSALILTDIGLVYYKTGNFDQALQYYEKAKLVQEEKRSSQHPSLSTIFNHIGAVFESKLMHPQAFDHYNKATNFITQGKLPEIGIASYNIASLYGRANNYDMALQNFLEAKTTFENIFGEGSQHPFLINTYKSISLMFKKKNGCLQNSSEVRPIQEKVLNGQHSILKQAMIKELEAQVSRSQNSSLQKDARIKELEAQVSRSQNTSLQKDARIKELEAQVSRSQNTTLQKEARMKGLEAKASKSQNTSLQREARIKELEVVVLKFTSINQDLQHDKERKDRHVKKLDTEILRLQAMIEDTQSQNINLKDDVKILKAQLKSALSQKDQIDRELNNLKAENDIESYRKIASAFYRKGYYGEALAFYEKTIAMQEEKLGSRSRHPSLGETFNDVGRVLYKQSKYDEAMNYFFRARAIQEEYHHPSLGDTCRNIGLVIHKRGNYDEALDYFQSARVFQEKGGNTSSLAKTYNCIGLVHSSKNNYGEAMRYYDKARSIQEETDLENPSLAKTFYNIGVLYNSRVLHELALKHLNKALEIQGKVGQHPSLAETYNAIGLVYFGQRNFEKALNMYGKAKEIQEKFLDKNNLDVSETFNNIGVTKCLQGEYDEALECCHKAKAIDEELLGLQHPLLSSTYSNLGYVYSQKGDDELSRQYYDKAKSIAGSF